MKIKVVMNVFPDEYLYLCSALGVGIYIFMKVEQLFIKFYSKLKNPTLFM